MTIEIGMDAYATFNEDSLNREIPSRVKRPGTGDSGSWARGSNCDPPLICP